ncbi:protein TolR [Alkalilimnicola sp. S0819]|nr:protein TolR [Alkalilimnicola sp. S0819]MPQ15180.1 protein TolR [Alkalilimnicola sp. S0819]
MSPASRRSRRRPMAEINVVPYIDVMLVLLVIFMVTAPLLYQGVEIELPRASAEPLPQQDQEAVLVAVDAEGNYYFSVGAAEPEAVDTDTLLTRVAAIVRRQPGTPVLVRGDQNVPYGKVVQAMVQLQAAGVPKVGLSTQMPDNAP